MLRRFTITFCFLSILAAGCSGDDPDNVDAGQIADVGGGDPDAGNVVDAGEIVDAGDIVDAGVEDTGVIADAGIEDTGVDADAGVEDIGGAGPILQQPQKGGPIAANESGDRLAVANIATDDVTIFELPALTELARIAVGDEPVSVTWGADNSTLFVVNRASQDAMRIANANTSTPQPPQSVEVGSEPGRGALSPSGDRLYVSNWVDGTLSVIDTGSFSVIRTVELGGAPYAVCVTNDGDAEDDDETIYVTDFYSRPIAGVPETDDEGRRGRVWTMNAATFDQQELSLNPVADVEIEATPGTGAFANQLYACNINRGRIYLTAVGASPESFNNGTDFRQNLQGLVYTFNLDGTFDDDRSGNLNALIDVQVGAKRFASVPVDLAFPPNTDIAYFASILSNSLFRVDFTNPNDVVGGAPNANFLETGFSPTGVAIVGTTAYVYNEVGRSVTSINLATQSVINLNTASAPQPADAAGQRALSGQRFFNTGQARWSRGAWVGCVGCHPFGTTDNISWSFPAGPRQTVDTSATYNQGGAVQRILNWTAIFDEVADFELNTRGVANGTGAIVSTSDLNADGSPNAAARIDFVGPGGVANPSNGFNVGSSGAVAAGGATPDDWAEIEEYIQTIRSPKGAKKAGVDLVAGRALFEAGNCNHCHGGVLWSLSERYITPRLDIDNRNRTFASVGVTDLGQVRADQVRTTDTSLLNVIENDTNGPPQRHTCVVRKVGTFGATGPDNRGSPEVRQNGAPAQGVDGFNVPSLLGVNQGAPYLHNGAAESLEVLLDPNGDFVAHLRSGNQVFSPTPAELTNLIAFLRSIDDSTPPILIPVEQRFCPTGL